MASNLQKRLDKIEKGLQQFLEAQNPSGPVYVSEGEIAPEGREAIRIVMHWVESEPVEDESADTVSAQNSACASRKEPSTLPPLETVAEREERWRKHLLAIDMRGERYQEEDGPRDLRRENLQRGVV